MAAEVGHLDLACDYFGEAALIDLDDLQHNTRDGFHTASLASTWIVAVGGFDGMRDHGAARGRAGAEADDPPANCPGRRHPGGGESGIGGGGTTTSRSPAVSRVARPRTRPRRRSRARRIPSTSGRRSPP